MHLLRRFLPVLTAVVAPLLSAADARAQLHWDVGAQAGVMQRVQTGAGAGAPSPGPGPAGELHGHVAVIPMLRAGPYVAFDVEPLSGPGGPPPRTFLEGGLRAKLAPPILTGSWRLWALLGLGYAWVDWPGHEESGASVAGLQGTLLDLPVGIGVGYRVRGPHDPWEITAELGARVGLAYFGPLYSDGARDSFALSLSVGVSLDE
jgi:hypothetical protein